MKIRGKDILCTLFCGPYDMDLDDLTPLSTKCPDEEKLKESIEKYGLVNTFDIRWIIGDCKFEILRGNQRYKVLKDLGWTKVPCHFKIIVTHGQGVTGVMLQKMLNAKKVSGETHKLARQPKEWDNG